MAAFELRLKWLAALDMNRWAYKALVFDMTMMTDEYVRPWTIQGIETGLASASSSPAVKKEVSSLLAEGKPRTIRFFSSGEDFLSGYKIGPQVLTNFGPTGASGVSSCAEGFGPEESANHQPTAPGSRTDLRMYLNPTGGTGMSLPSSDESYHPTYSYLIGTLWHEFHHMAAADNEQHGLHTAPPYEPVWQTAMAAIRSGFPPVAWDPVMKKSVPLWTNQWAMVPCLCDAIG